MTFNTLIDAMGKAGRWQDAIGVLDIIDQQVQPYGTLPADSEIVILKHKAVAVYWAPAGTAKCILNRDRHALQTDCPVDS